MERFLACPIVPLSQDKEETSVPLSQKVALSCPVENPSCNYVSQSQTVNRPPVDVLLTKGYYTEGLLFNFYGVLVTNMLQLRTLRYVINNDYHVP